MIKMGMQTTNRQGKHINPTNESNILRLSYRIYWICVQHSPTPFVAPFFARPYVFSSWNPRSFMLGIVLTRLCEYCPGRHNPRERVGVLVNDYMQDAQGVVGLGLNT
jgi:hypothetical protein